MELKRIQQISATLLNSSVVDFNKDFVKQISIDELFDIGTSSSEERVIFRAAWALEHLLLEDKSSLKRNSPNILNFYINSNNWSALRSISKVLIRLIKDNYNFLCLREKSEVNIINKSFQLLEHPGCPIALKCNLYDIIYEIAKHNTWLMNELKNQLVLDLEKNNSPALKSRGNKILKLLKKEYHLY